MSSIEKNEGTIDRVSRSIVGVILITFGLTLASGIAKPVSLFMGASTIISAILGWCPLYIPFGIDTCKGRHKKKKD